MAGHASSPLEAEHFVVTLDVAGVRRKLFRVQFEHGSKGLGYYVHVPYFPHAEGLLGRYTVVGPAGTSADIKLDIGTTTTRERVKLSHHADGRAHFSQDERAKTEVRTRTARLRDARGHVFSVQFWGADGFAPAGRKEEKPPRRSRTTLRFTLGDQEQPADTVAGRISGWWYPRRMVRFDHRAAAPPNFTRAIAWQLEDGTIRPALVLAPPDPRPADDVLMLLTYHPEGIREPGRPPALVLLGGFDAPGDPTRPDARATFLVLMYADRGATFAELERRLGSIDLRPSREG